jgi:hypothetical protein
VNVSGLSFRAQTGLEICVYIFIIHKILTRIMRVIQINLFKLGGLEGT